MTTLLNNLSYLGELLALCIVLILCFLYRKSVLFLLASLFLVIVCSETLGKFQIVSEFFTVSKSSLFIIENVCMILEVIVYQIVLLLVVQRKQAKQCIAVNALITVVIASLCSLFVQPLHKEFPTIAFSYGSISVMLFILYYLKEQLEFGSFELFFKNFWFWIFMFLFFSLTIEIPIMSILNYMLNNQKIIYSIRTILNIKLIFSSLYYFSFIVSYLCKTRI